jgi:hypothetical protein
MDIQIFNFVLNFWFLMTLCLMFLVFGLLMARGATARNRM